MDDLQFDRLTRRFVLGGLASGTLLALRGFDDAAARKRSKRKRCRKKQRIFCAGRCCPKRLRCERKTCVQSCDNPFMCPDQGGGGCGGGPLCFCSTTISGTSACVISESAACANFAACGVADPCPAGQICAICGCLDETPDFRCKRPCGAG